MVSRRPTCRGDLIGWRHGEELGEAVPAAVWPIGRGLPAFCRLVRKDAARRAGQTGRLSSVKI